MTDDFDIRQEGTTSKEKDFENALRPLRFGDFSGQPKVVENLEVFVEAAKYRGEPLDHTLLHGPPGLGKTTLSNIIANELGVGFKMRFEPIFQQARRYVPLVGCVNSIVTTKLQAFNPRPESAWVTRTGAMYELSIHDFDLISYITGLYPEKVEFADIGHRFGWEKDDAFHLAVRYDGGVTALLQGMYAVSSTFCYRDLTITVLGDQGYVRIERPDRIIVHTDHYEVVEIPAAEKSAFVCELEHFKGACEGRWKNTLTAESATRMTDMIEEARRLGER